MLNLLYLNTDLYHRIKLNTICNFAQDKNLFLKKMMTYIILRQIITGNLKCNSRSAFTWLQRYEVYEKWMIVQKNIRNQFIKYSISSCNYQLEWIERDGHRKIKRKMWAGSETAKKFVYCAFHIGNGMSKVLFMETLVRLSVQ